MNDRLGELTGGGGGSNVAPFEIAIDINDDGGGRGGGGGESATFMEGFFDKVNAVKKDIDAVKKVRCTDNSASPDALFRDFLPARWCPGLRCLAHISPCV